MLLNELFQPLKQTKALKKLVRKHGVPSLEVLKHIRKNKKCNVMGDKH